MWQDYFQLLLKQKYKNSIQKNKAYSLRAFSEKIGVSSGDASELMSGKRKISKKRALKISEKLDLTDAEQTTLNELAKNENKLQRQRITVDQNFILQSQIYLPLICSLELDTPAKDTKTLAKSLNQTEAEIILALDLLARKGIITKIDGQYRMVNKSLTTSEDIPNDVYKQALKNDFEANINAIDHISVHERECTSITFAGSSATLEDLKKEIRTFRDRISILSGKNTKDQVYRLTVGLIPLTSHKTSPMTTNSKDTKL